MNSVSPNPLLSLVPVCINLTRLGKTPKCPGLPLSTWQEAVGAPEMPMEGEAAPQRVSLPQTLLRMSWRENGFFLVRLLLNLVMVSLPIYVFRLSYREMEAI